MEKKRFILALLISGIILVSWSYFFPPPPPSPRTDQPSEITELEPSPPAETPVAKEEAPSAEVVEETTPRKTITVITPLYTAEIDNQGAVVKSWILKKNKETGRDLYSAGGTRQNPKPLELVSEEGLKRGQAPLLLLTGNKELDDVLAGKNYSASVDGSADVQTIELSPEGLGERSVDFELKDAATGLVLTKTITFSASSYSTSVEVRVESAPPNFPQPKLVIGPSTGDQGVPHYTFYLVPPEGVVLSNREAQRLYASYIEEDKNTPGRQAVAGPVDWAAVGDTYFAMAAIPAKPVPEVEYRSEKYEHHSGSTKEVRYLISGLMPVPTDGTRTVLYVGPKDHNLLQSASGELSQAMGRPVDLDGLINYGWLSFMSRPLAVPIIWSIKKLYDLTGSYGLAIILFTIVIYSLFFPLKWRSSKAMKKAAKLAPRMKEIQEKIKGLKQNDPRLKELQKEQLRLMKEGNPLGGCLPLLLQMPFLFALYIAITVSIEFRQASFLWMPDLSAGDPFHILEFLMAGSMIVLQLITPAPSADPMQRKLMAFGMPLFMLYILWGAPSGLLVYWLVGNIVGFGQQFLINHLTKSEDDPEPPAKKKMKEKTSRAKKLETARA